MRTQQNSSFKQFDKDFAKSFQNKQKLDPFLYTTDTVKKEIQYFRTLENTSSMFSASVAAFVTAPFQTIATALQLSVQPHKNIHDKQAINQNPDLSPDSKQIKKINTNLTIQEKRRLELQIRAAQKQPYTAPVYSGYVQAIRGLANQGWLAFFKGTGFRVAHTIFHIYPMIYVSDLIRNQEAMINPFTPLIMVGQMYIFKCIADISVNMLHVGQNRMILQNNIKQFRSYKSGWQMMKKLGARNQMSTGWSYHLINNFIDVTFRLPLYFGVSPNIRQMQNRQQIVKYLSIPLYIGELLIYPFNTAFRRIVCQCTTTPGMIPIRYKSLGHTIKVMFFEEGIKGLYRGFAMYHLIVLLRIGIISSITVSDQIALQSQI